MIRLVDTKMICGASRVGDHTTVANSTSDKNKGTKDKTFGDASSHGEGGGGNTGDGEETI